MENGPPHPKDLTIAGLVHDLNNVFQTLVEAADLLSQDPQWESISGLIVRSVERGKELTNALQKADQPPATLANILSDARSFVEDLVLTGRGPAIHFECEVDPTLELRRAHSWERVFINLFLNSVRAMPTGGTIFVHGRRLGKMVEIVVADNGPGIAPELIAEIFKPHVSSRRDGGLGLHIVDSIVKEHAGAVSVINLPGGGAQFNITLPTEALFGPRV